MQISTIPAKFVRRPESYVGDSQCVQRFNELQGKLRVSVTHACQLRCRFCHREGINEHWKNVTINPEFFARIVRAYRNLGGRFVELTGGEPTTHPRIGNLVDIAHESNADTILCTNGLKLDRVLPQIREGKVGLIKLSLHATDSREQAKSLLGDAWCFEKLCRNVEQALAAGAAFQLIFTHSHQNTRFLEPVLDLALQWNVDLQVVDLITTRAHRPAEELGYVTGEEGQRIVATRGARLEREVRDRTGAVLKLYRTSSGKVWEVKDFHFGLLHSRMCDGCPRRRECGEGIYALRVDALGVVKPCLLREDLQRNVPPSAGIAGIERVLSETLGSMLSGKLAWN